MKIKIPEKNVLTKSIKILSFMNFEIGILKTHRLHYSEFFYIYNFKSYSSPQTVTILYNFYFSYFAKMPLICKRDIIFYLGSILKYYPKENIF